MVCKRVYISEPLLQAASLAAEGEGSERRFLWHRGIAQRGHSSAARNRDGRGTIFRCFPRTQAEISRTWLLPINGGDSQFMRDCPLYAAVVSRKRRAQNSGEAWQVVLLVVHDARGAGNDWRSRSSLHPAGGTKWLPERLRLKRYKLWMRTVLALWWAVILFGVATYARWYTPHLFAALMLRE